uniref:Major facilitator superfamily (MFS) profile domain-containing protein n=1 Tax=Ciona savignyi TaxID=51511 RepID=H2YS25_CIOSA
SEFMPVRLRSFGFYCAGMGYAFGYVMIAGLAYFIRDWRVFLKVCGSAEFIYLLYYFWIDETPRWLHAKGKMEEGRKIIQKISKMNNKDVSVIEDEIMALKSSSELSIGSWDSFLMFVKQPILLMRLAILCFAWTIVIMTYYAIALNLNSLSGNRFLNIFFGGLMEVCNVTLFCIFVETKGRRNTYIGMMIICALGIASTPFISVWFAQLSVATTMLSKLTVGVSFSVLYLYPAELFPTNLRQTTFGFCNMFGRIGGLIAPFLIYSKNGNTLIPSLATSAIIFFSVAQFLFLPKTKANQLPQNVEDALRLK